MGKKFLREQTMGSVYVDHAALLARQLTHREARGPGDMENAWRRLERRYGVPWRAFWRLRYRPPKDVAAAILARLIAAHEAECKRHIRKLKHELEITRAKAGALHPAVVEAEALVRAEEA